MEDINKCRLLTVKQVAQILNIGKTTVYGYAARGQLKPIYMPMVRPSTAIKRNKKSIRFTLEEVNKFYETICA